MAESGHGLQIVTVTADHDYVLEQTALEELLLHKDVKDLPVVVVSVAGAYRGGKSFLLNFFLRYLSSPSSAQQDGSWLSEDSGPLTGFVWRSGIEATTMGILMWSKPFIMELPNKEKVAVLLVDTQGTFDSKSTVRDNSTVFALSTLVSSVQIYNLSRDVKEDDLQHLELFTEYGKLVNTTNSNAKAFQMLEFLVRDWQFDDDGSHPYGRVGGERLLQEKFEITRNLPKDMKNLREHILSSFEKVSCFLMPHPGHKVEKKIFAGIISDIEPDFREKVVDFVNFIFGPEKLLPKTVNGQMIKTRDLYNYFKTYMELFNSDEIPTPLNIMAMTVKAGFLSAVSEAHDIYEKGMDSECGPEQLSVSAVDLKFLHEKYVKLATDFFTNKKKMGSSKEAAEYLEKLTKELNDRLPQFLQSNLAKVQTAINKSKEAYDEAIQNITKDQVLCVHAVDLEKVYLAGLEAATTIYDASRKTITDKVDKDRAKFIEGFEKQHELLRRTNEQNNNMIITEIKMGYWQQMQSKANLEPPLSDVEFKKEHADALKKALDLFKSKRNMPNNYNEDVHEYYLAKGIKDNFATLKALNRSKNKVAMQAGIDEYDKFMGEQWDRTTECLHPEDLEETHRLGTCRALEKFHPRKKCSDGFDDDDEDESTLKTILSQRYEDYQKTNGDLNETALLMAYNEYVRLMDDNCRFSLWWLLVIPYIVNRNRREMYHEQSKQQAIPVFYAKRAQGVFTTHHDSDPYRSRLDTLMNEYYVKNYK